MADTKVSALPAVSSLNDTDEVPLNQGGVSRKMTLTQLDAYVESRARVNNASVSTPAAGFASDTYLVGSSCAIPAGRLQAKAMYRCKFSVSKTAAGVVAPVINVRFGTAGSTADSSRATLTFAAQTAVVDTGFIEVFVTFRTVGSGTAAILEAVGTITHTLTATGLSTAATSIAITTTGTGFDSTVANSILGISVNGGTSAAWTIALVQAELYNLA